MVLWRKSYELMNYDNEFIKDLCMIYKEMNLWFKDALKELSMICERFFIYEGVAKGFLTFLWYHDCERYSYTCMDHGF